MVAILKKSDATEGFKQIIDFLSGSYINHALTVNPHVYISCIKQFWNTAIVKRSGDVTRLQGLVDKKRIVITEEVVREILQLNDAEGQRFNFSKYIFESLVRNVDSSSKFYMYPRFIQLIIQTNIADLSTHTTSYISPVLTQKVFANMRRVRKGFSGVETPLFENMLAVRDVDEEEEAQVPAQGDEVQEPAAEEVANDVVPPTPTSHHLLSFHLHLLTNHPVHLNHKMQKVHLICFSRDPEKELHSDTPAETPKVKDKGKGILIGDPKPLKKKDQVEMDADLNMLLDQNDLLSCFMNNFWTKQLSQVHSTFHVSNLKKCFIDEPLAISLDEIQIDDKLNFIKEQVEIMDQEVKRLKQSGIPIVKVCWNTRRGPEFTWEREAQMKKKYPHLFVNPSSTS
nr:putative reverse transcriptase domain-containing protein [Tanacetum cinerariifolium]